MSKKLNETIPNVPVRIESIRKNHYRITINNILIGTYERSEIRHIIEQLDKMTNHFQPLFQDWTSKNKI